MPPEKGTIVPLPPSAERLEAVAKLEKPQNFVPSVSVNAKQWVRPPTASLRAFLVPRPHPRVCRRRAARRGR